MQITILALGSRGDVLPCVALAEILRAAGHGVRLATFENFAGMVTGRDLDLVPVRGDAQAILANDAGQALAESGQSAIRMALAVMRSFGRLASGIAQDLMPLLSAPTDLILNQLPGGLYGLELSEKLGVPMLALAVIPLIPTRALPLMAFPYRPGWPGRYNLWTYWLGYQLVWQGFRPAINRWRQADLGLPPAPWGGQPYLFRDGPVPVLLGVSPQVVARPPDWGGHVHLTGYWFPRAPDWSPPRALLRFLDTGPPPVFVGFGSMSLRDPARTLDVVLEALAQIGRRGIVHAGWGGLAGHDLPGEVYAIDYAPYDWLFPRMAAVVHHGGSGTTAFALRAGVPSLVVPFLFDQFYWGRRVHELGAGSPPLPYKKLTTGSLAEAIRRATGDPLIGHSAAQIGAAIRRENGLQRAVELVESYGRYQVALVRRPDSA
jgi:UDP:flavonoid glycosyltransferase YjiC (YdhE family)